MILDNHFTPEWCSPQSAYSTGLENLESNFNLELGSSAMAFLELLDLPKIHPACNNITLIQHFHETVVAYTARYPVVDIFKPFKSLVTVWNQTAPPLLAMTELWLRLFAFFVAPLSLAYLLHLEIKSKVFGFRAKDQPIEYSLPIANTASLIALVCSSTLLTDPLYVHEFGRKYGALMFLASSYLLIRRGMVSISSLLSTSQSESSSIATTHAGNGESTMTEKPNRIFPIIFNLILLAVIYQVTYHLILHPEDSRADIPTYRAGLHFSKNNEFISKIVEQWPVASRVYEGRADIAEEESPIEPTPWTITGDSRTGIPFLLNPTVQMPRYHRLWVPSREDPIEAVALDIAFPFEGEVAIHRTDKPFYLVLHGLNGGSNEEYVKEFVNRQVAQGCTVAVMIARGLMGTPIIGSQVFHGARISDVATCAERIKAALNSSHASNGKELKSKLIGVGYSMGAIVLANYVARSGKTCALDGAVSVSGGLDMREQYYFHRSMRLWQPMLAQELRKTILTGTRQKYESTLSEEHFSDLMRAIHITDIDKVAVVRYNGFRDVMHYYSEMSALGDFDGNNGRITNVSIPLLVLHALDDPLITWRSVGNPDNVINSGRGYVMLLLTKGGGHVGWPLGYNPRAHGWYWMNSAIDGFSKALVAASASQS